MIRLLLSILAVIFALTSCSTPRPQEAVERAPAKSKEYGKTDEYFMEEVDDPKPKLSEIPDNLGVVEFDQSDISKFDQIVAISDGHGNYDRVRRVLRAAKIIDDKNNWIAKRTLLIVTGDSIDKGPQSIEMLELYEKLSRKEQSGNAGGQVIHLIGNHEMEFLDEPENAKKDEKTFTFIVEMKQRGQKVKAEYFNWRKPIARFLRTMPVAVRVGKFVFSHSGRYPKDTWADFVKKIKKLVPKGDYLDEYLTDEEKSIVTSFDWTEVKDKDKGTDKDTLKKAWRNMVEAKVHNKDILYGSVFGHQASVFDIKGHVGARTYGADRGQEVLFVKLDTGHGNNIMRNQDNPDKQYGAELIIFPRPQQLLDARVPDMEWYNEKGEHGKVEVLPVK